MPSSGPSPAGAPLISTVREETKTAGKNWNVPPRWRVSAPFFDSRGSSPARRRGASIFFLLGAKSQLNWRPGGPVPVRARWVRFLFFFFFFFPNRLPTGRPRASAASHVNRTRVYWSDPEKVSRNFLPGPLLSGDINFRVGCEAHKKLENRRPTRIPKHICPTAPAPRLTYLVAWVVSPNPGRRLSPASCARMRAP